jgi:hypothetical protein
LRYPPDRPAASAALLILAVIRAKNRLNAREPPIGIAKIRCWIETAFYRTPWNLNNALVQAPGFFWPQALGVARSWHIRERFEPPQPAWRPIALDGTRILRFQLIFPTPLFF